MKARHTFWALSAAIVLYVAALLWTDSRGQVFAQLPQVAAALPWLAAASLLTYGLRYARWQWLLRRTQAGVPLGRGWLAYLSGFAFTATPGKVGELVRIRYFAAMGVPPSRVLAAFVFERACDLIAITLIAAMAIQDAGLFMLLLGFVAVLLGAVAWLAARPRPLGRVAAWLRQRGYRLLARTLRIVQQGLAGCRIWLTPLDGSVSMAASLLAWGLTALSFAWLMAQMGVPLPLRVALSAYPTAMLAGAASMLPGGLGSTELTLVALLVHSSVPLGIASLAAVAIRLSSLWFAVLCGFVAMAALEHGRTDGGR